MSNIEYKYIPEHKTKLWKRHFKKLAAVAWSKKRLAAAYDISVKSLNTKLQKIDNLGLYKGYSFSPIQLKKIFIELGFPSKIDAI